MVTPLWFTDEIFVSPIGPCGNTLLINMLYPYKLFSIFSIYGL